MHQLSTSVKHASVRTVGGPKLKLPVLYLWYGNRLRWLPGFGIFCEENKPLFATSRRQYDQTVESMDYIELLKNGFSLEWTGINCVECQLSIGRCGSDENNDAVCFCPDRPHTKHCNDGEAKND